MKTCVCVCVCAHACECVHLCECIKEREDRHKKMETKTERYKEQFHS